MENMELKNKIITFCFPYRGAGGVPLLFLRLANNLNKLNYNVTIIDYIDGFMALNNTENINFIEYKDSQKVVIDTNSILILQAMTPWSIFSSLDIKKDVRLFFISTIPANFYPFLPILRDKMSQGGLFSKIIWNTFLRDEYRKVFDFIELNEKKKSLVFLDEDIVSNVGKNMNFKFIEPSILPLFSNNVERNFYLDKENIDDKSITVGWVGRISDFKVHILNKVIIDLKNYSDSNDIRIKLIIIGTGEKESELIQINTNKFTIDRMDYLKPSDLNEKLLSFDLYFAMGTSALDGARLGIPTIRLDYSYKKINDDYKYKFLFDIKGHSLGELIDGDFYNKGLYSMENVISKFMQVKELLSSQVYSFYSKNHSLDSSTNKFLKLLVESELKYSDLSNKNLLNSRLYDLWKRVRSR